MKVDSITKVFTFARDELIALCAFASEDDMRANVNGIALYDDRHAAVATDGHRLAVLTAYTADDYSEADGDGVMLPLEKAKQAIKSSRRGDWIVISESAGLIHVVRPKLPTKLTADAEDVETVDVCVIAWAPSVDSGVKGAPPAKVRPPPAATVLPKFDDPRGSAQTLNASFLRDLEKVTAAVASTESGAEVGVRLWPGKSWDSPVGFSSYRWTGCIMPMRSHTGEKVALPAGRKKDAAA